MTKASNEKLKTRVQTVSELIEITREVVVGKDLLELVSSSMYVDPLTIFREYIQNSVDAIDQAVDAGLLDSAIDGRIDISLDHIGRRVVLRDNGIGLANSIFERQLVSFGASEKRGTDARGFRGIGRLAGLGYCQQLKFRSKSLTDSIVKEMHWDGVLLKRLLADTEFDGDLTALINQIVTVNDVKGDEYPDHFFEVELVKPRRIGKDILLNEISISNYIAQVCPVSFGDRFKFKKEIKKIFDENGFELREYRIHINDSDQCVLRPYSNVVQYSESKIGECYNVEKIEIRSQEDELSALGWVLHHDYQGAIPTGQLIRGLRARVGNIQVGDDRVFVDVFPEDRFNSWSIGELHMLDNRIVPNGRRDNFEPNAHLTNIFTHLLPVANEIARQCRNISQVRNRIKSFELGEDKINEVLNILEQEATSKSLAASLRRELGSLIGEIRRIVDFELIDHAIQDDLRNRVEALEARARQLTTSKGGNDPLKNLPKSKQSTYREVISLIYECSGNRVVAKALIDKILNRISQ